MTDVHAPQSQPESVAAEGEATQLVRRSASGRGGQRHRRDLAAAAGQCRLAALGVAAAHLHADRADPAVPARARLDPRFGAAAAGDRPRRGAAVLHLASRSRALAEPPRAVQRVRRALVRGDLPAALRLAGRVRGAADLPARRLGKDAAAARTAEPGAAAALVVLLLRAVARGRGRRGGRGARRAAVPAAAVGGGRP